MLIEYVFAQVHYVLMYIVHSGITKIYVYTLIYTRVVDLMMLNKF